MLHYVRCLYFPFVSLASLANVVGTLVIFLLVATMNVDVVARGIFHAPLKGVVEVVIFSLILIVFMQLPDVVRHNRLTRSDGFLVLGRKAFPRVASVISRLIDLAGCIFMGLIAWTMWPEFVHSIETCHFITPPEFGPPPSGNWVKDIAAAFGRCEYFGTPGIFTAPWWPAKLAIVFSVSLSSVIFFFKAVLGDHANGDKGVGA